MQQDEIGILGGSFNPIHNGHLALASQAQQHMGLQQVLFMPTGTPPHKPQGLADAQMRLEMVRLAITGHPGFAVEEYELGRPGTNYTVDTLRALKQRWPGRKLWLLVGADTLMDLLNWRTPEEVMSMAGFLYCSRPGVGEDAVRIQIQRLESMGAEVRTLPVSGPAISSTEIRRRLAVGESVAGLVPRSVFLYLCETGLYREPDSIRAEQVRTLRGMLPEKRFAHSLSVEQEARAMALRFGLNALKAACAGLLHDCARGLPLAEMRRIVREAGLALDDTTLQSEALLHAPAGMVLAQTVFGIRDADILDAIRWHTTGRAGMSGLEKVVYLADVIEPLRRAFPAMETIRGACRVDLDEAMRGALASSIAYVHEKHQALHPDTQRAYQFFTEQ